MMIAALTRIAVATPMIVKKGVDKPLKVWYYNYRKRKERYPL